MSTALGLAALLSINTSAKATLIAYEGFDYAHGQSITQQNGGTGWGSAWSSAGASVATNYAYSLTYVNGGSLVVSGNHLRDGYQLDQYGGQTVNVQRALPGTNALSVYGNTIWISFLAQNLNTTIGGAAGYRETKFILMRGATTNANGSANVVGNETLDVGTPNTYLAGATDQYTLWAGNATPFVNTGIATDRGVSPGETAATMFLLRLDLDGTTANDTASLWINPVIGYGTSALTLGTPNAVVSSINLDWANAFRFAAGNKNASGTNATWNVDELRIGTTYGDVTPAPEPSTVALLGVALSGLWLTIRRKRQS